MANMMCVDKTQSVLLRCSDQLDQLPNAVCAMKQLSVRVLHLDCHGTVIQVSSIK